MGTHLEQEDPCLLAEKQPDQTEPNNKRDQWSRKAEFIVCAISGAVGTGNIWRFPYLCYKNGGGAFLVPYLIFLIAIGLPMFILEIGVGQYTQRAGFEVWNICPLFKGIGVAAIFVTFVLDIYYVLVLTWSAFYFVKSLTLQLPWSHCNNEWNSDMCIAVADVLNVTVNNTSDRVDSTVEFWRYKVLQISNNIGFSEGIVVELAVCSLFVWILLFFCVCRGIKLTGKIAYITALLPYVILTILLIRGATLDGAKEGIVFYLKPDFEKLSNYQVWIDAGTQILFSMALTFGVLQMLGSYNKFNNNFYRDCIIVASVNSFTSLYGGFAVFSILGFMAKNQGVSVAEVADGGPSLAFITYPMAVTQMPIAPFWSSLFFLMMFIVGAGTEIVGIEAVITPIVDLCPNKLRTVKGRVILIAVYCIISYLLGLILVTKGGIHVFNLLDYYGASGMMLVWQLMWEAIAIGWVVGAGNFIGIIEEMIGYRIGPWWKFSWRYGTPAISMVLLVLQCINFNFLPGENNYEYPTIAHVFGAFFSIITMMAIPLMAMWQLFRQSGSFCKRLKKSIQPQHTPKRSLLKSTSFQNT